MTQHCLPLLSEVLAPNLLGNRRHETRPPSVSKVLGGRNATVPLAFVAAMANNHVRNTVLGCRLGVLSRCKQPVTCQTTSPLRTDCAASMYDSAYQSEPDDVFPYLQTSIRSIAAHSSSSKCCFSHPTNHSSSRPHSTIAVSEGTFQLVSLIWVSSRFSLSIQWHRNTAAKI